MVAAMKSKLQKKPPLWQTILVVVLILAMGLYAANYPHSFLGQLLRIVFTP
jgi:hypothetical protein